MTLVLVEVEKNTRDVVGNSRGQNVNGISKTR